MQNNLSQPLFASAGNSTAQDDIDLNEIFAEYFINEFDDPLNAYTSSMANFNGGATAVAMTQEDPATIANNNNNSNTNSNNNSIAAAPAVETPRKAVSASTGVSLPTGGIRTVFHGAQQQQQQQATMAAPVTGQIPVAPATKKAKLDGVAGQQHLQQQPQVPLQQAPVQKPTGGITLPLGVVVNHPGMPTAMQAHQQALAAAAGAAQAQAVGTVPSASGMVPLPVGVGIRLGGVGGIAPATVAQSAPAAPNQFLWGAAVAASGGISEQAVAERRQRNREHAKRSRVRKKFMLESLQEEVRALQRENQELRMLVQEHIPENAMKIIGECCKSSPLFDEETELTTTQSGSSMRENETDKTTLEKADFTLMHSLASGQQCFVLSDPKLPDNPIVFASPGFYKLTGYSSQEVLGRNCRFLQGPGTDVKTVEVIRKAVATGSDATVCLLNYKSDGTPFWNQFFMAALRDSDNCIVNYVGVQCEVEPQTGASALEDKVNAVMPLQTKED